MMLRTEELQEQILKDTRIIHFGTLSMTDEPVRSATRHAIETAKANGAMLSFDPNNKRAALAVHGRGEETDRLRDGSVRCAENIGQ